ncbi:bifunctional diaminohydroxyphosphoribosylaminopyrimidine deaminase/5-amino-6-(5-phosphoribosylamino)uracil reductase RibD [Candidatus Marinamargulisbacteria bacterium SCGC AAA071-K20]|nr:bifunctional diaminohydroxyphosphoribosylaminopyrimidine deaminase/5-amino-6-(5-phosphoribosylamino)uracil reductase RibD [Candidatus Marinamargulisbacteria bacterium SCGC AAA071-K20]
MFSQFELKIMNSLIEQAGLMRGRTGKNPVVAAAIINKHELISEGIHQKEGSDHAEIIAIKNAGHKCKGATLLVTLEPCTHHGKTPPCNQAIINAKFKKVVYAVKDPNPNVAQLKGDKLLEAAGIEVLSGCCEREAIALNEVFFKRHTKYKSFVTLKMAQSLDGKIAINDNTTKYITSKSSLRQVHKLRREADAILVGIGTVLDDDPMLNIRYNLLEEGYKNPIKIILDTHLRTPTDARIITENIDTEIVIFTKKKKGDKHLFPSYVTIIESETLSIKSVLKVCFNRGLYNIFVEGGPQIYKSFLESGEADKAVIFIAPSNGKKNDVTSPFQFNEHYCSEKLEDVTMIRFENDVCISGLIK